MEKVSIKSWMLLEEGDGGHVEAIYAPRSGEVVGEVSYFDVEHFDELVDGISLAQKGWADLTFKRRAEVIFTFRQAILDNKDRLIEAIELENGKQKEEAAAEVAKAVELCEFAVSVPSLISGRTQVVSTGIEVKERNEPLGIVASITPFNFPLMVPMWTIPNILVTGNAIILKPSEKTPLTAMILAELLEASGLPKGIFNVIHGGKEVVDKICTHPGIKSVTFVGSTPVAKLVYQNSTQNLKQCLALGGAKNHILVTDEVNVEITAKEILSAAFGMSGQRCMAASVVVAVGESDALTSELIKQAKDYIPGNNMGPIITRESVTEIESYLAKTKGRVLLDGRLCAQNGLNQGYYFGPSIIEYDAYELMPDVEVFGPVLEVVRTKTLEEAIKLQNKSSYANGASIFTDMGEVADEAVKGLSSGMLGVNIGVPVPRDPFSFGGLKMSKFGTGDITGYNSLILFTQTKKVTTKWNPRYKKDWMS